MTKKEKVERPSNRKGVSAAAGGRGVRGIHLQACGCSGAAQGGTRVSSTAQGTSLAGKLQRSTDSKAAGAVRCGRGSAGTTGDCGAAGGCKATAAMPARWKAQQLLYKITTQQRGRSDVAAVQQWGAAAAPAAGNGRLEQSREQAGAAKDSKTAFGVPFSAVFSLSRQPVSRNAV